MCMEGERTHIIDSSWDDTKQILESLREGDTDVLEQYDHIDDATDLVNYVEENLATSQETQDRVETYFLNDVCPACEQHNYDMAVEGDVDDQQVDPTLEKHAWVDSEESRREDADQRHTAYFVAKCGNMHDDMFLTYEETWHE